jgi:hypothetical protein
MSCTTGAGAQRARGHPGPKQSLSPFLTHAQKLLRREPGLPITTHLFLFRGASTPALTCKSQLAPTLTPALSLSRHGRPPPPLSAGVHS